MKKMLILAILLVASIAKTDNEIINNASKTLYGASIISGGNFLRNAIPAVTGKWFMPAIGIVDVARFPWTLRTSLWGIISTICYNNAKKLSELIKNQ